MTVGTWLKLTLEMKCIAVYTARLATQMYTHTHTPTQVGPPGGTTIKRRFRSCLDETYFPFKDKVKCPLLCSQSMSNSLNGTGEPPKPESSRVNGSAGHRDNHYSH